VHTSAARRGAPTASLLSFDKALAEAPSLCQELDAGGAPASLASILGTSAGARGFFVNWLTGEYAAADAPVPPPALCDALRKVASRGQTGLPTLEVMVMNVAMSAATAIAHRAAGDQAQAEASDRTCTRACTLVRAMRGSVPDLDAAVVALGAATDAASRAETEAGALELLEASGGGFLPLEWLAFLGKWSYDGEQLAAVARALERCESAE
jgi:hypothetical protein